jgi:hypothetical protein
MIAKNPASPMSPGSRAPAGTNFLGEALSDSRVKFRQLVTSLDTLVTSGRTDEARGHLPKLEAMRVELHRLLNPRDTTDAKALTQIDRDSERLRKALKKGWGGQAAGLLLATIIGGTLGVAALLWGMWHFFG